MKSYVDYVLRKEKKAISLERLFSKIEDMISRDKGERVILTDEEKKR